MRLGAVLAALLPATMAGIPDSDTPIILAHTMTQMPTCCPDECCNSKSCSMEACIPLKEINVNATVTVFSEGTVGGAQQFFNATMSIHGQSTAVIFPKQAFNLRPKAELAGDGKSTDIELLGLPKGHKFVLKGPYADQSLIHDALAFKIATQTGRYASRTRLVEVYVAPFGTPVEGVDFWKHYMGVYILQEKILRDKHRVNISKDDDAEHDPAQTGWIISVDKHQELVEPYDPVNRTKRGVNLQVSYPDIYDDEDYTPAQTRAAESYILGAVDAFETALWSPNFMDPVAGYAAHIDVGAFIDYFIVTELTTSVDAYRFSTYFFKDSCAKVPDDCKIKMGPAWDYDLAVGMCGNGYAADSDACNTDRWRYEWENRQHLNHYSPPARPEGPNTAAWYGRLLADPAFVDRLQARWRELRAERLSDDFFAEYISQAQSDLETKESAKRNFARWLTLGATWVWPYRDDANNPYRPLPQPKSYDDEMAYLQRWTQARLAWLDKAMAGPMWHTYTAVGTACDVRGPYSAETVGADCAPGCDADNIDKVQYPDCVRKVHECREKFAAGVEGPYGPWVDEARGFAVKTGSNCEFLHYIHVAKADRCPDAEQTTALYCAHGKVCSTEPDPPTPEPTAPTPEPTATAPTLEPTAVDAPTARAPTGSAPTPAVAPTSAPGEEAVAELHAYPGYQGPLSVSGTVRVGGPDGEGYLVVTYQVAGLEPGATGGLHIHVGESCAEDAEVGGHYWDAEAVGAADPWTGSEYVADAGGAASGQNLVLAGLGLAQVVDHALVVHDASTKRVACGILVLSAGGDSASPNQVMVFALVGGAVLTLGLAAVLCIRQQRRQKFALLANQGFLQDEDGGDYVPPRTSFHTSNTDSSM